jgi:triosephosphate isomerase
MAQRRKLISGNWKMHKDLEGCRALASAIAAGLDADLNADVLLFPPAPFLSTVVDAVAGASQAVGVGSQNLHHESQGAFTGEISHEMIRSTGADWALIGHSERRQIFGEDDAFLNKKVLAALEADLHAVLCVGETLEEREAGQTEDVVLGQVRGGLAGLDSAAIAKLVIAYEPVWAIGTGKTATPEQGAAVHASIRAEIGKLASPEVAANLRILYGGSVNPQNVKDLLSEPDIDGALVGGASLDADKFLQLCYWDRDGKTNE